MSELLAISLKTRQWYRSLQSVSESSWLAWLVVSLAAALLGVIFFQTGLKSSPVTTNPNGPLLAYGLLIVFLGAFWFGYRTIDGQRPAGWRHLPKTSWFFGQAFSSANWLIMLYLLTIGAYYLGAGWQQELAWSFQVMLVLCSIFLSLGTVFLAISLALGLKILSRNYFVRTVIFVLFIFALTLGLPSFVLLNQAIDSVFREPAFNSLWLVVLLGVGLTGASVALLEFACQKYPVSLQPRYRFWQLKLPSKSLTTLSNVGLFLTATLAALRHTAMQRRLITAIVVSIAGAAIIGLLVDPTRNGSALFGLMLASSLTLSAVISFALGECSEKLVETFRTQPIAPSRIRLNYGLAAVAIVVVMDSAYFQLFAGQFTLSNLVLVFTASLLAVIFCFKLGSYTFQRASGPRASSLQTQSPAVLAVIFLSLLTLLGWLFSGVVSLGLTITVITLWTLCLYGYLERAARSLQ